MRAIAAGSKREAAKAAAVTKAGGHPTGRAKTTAAANPPA